MVHLQLQQYKRNTKYTFDGKIIFQPMIISFKVYLKVQVHEWLSFQAMLLVTND